MVDFYCSWCKDLCDSKKALDVIRDSNEFSGIELSNSSNDIDKILASGLKVSVHNPSRFFKVSLSSPNFIEVITQNPAIIESCKKASLPFVSFHIGHFSNTFSKEAIISNTRKNLRFLDRELNKKILFESLLLPSFLMDSDSEKESALYSTSIEYMKDIISSTNADVLLDVAHTLCSASTRIRSNNYKGTEKDYFLDVLNVVSKNIFEVHINSPLYTKAEGYIDKHFAFKANEVPSKTVFECTSEVLAVSPNLKSITLEIEPHLEPVKHAKIMVKQAKLVRKKLNL